MRKMRKKRVLWCLVFLLLLFLSARILQTIYLAMVDITTSPIASEDTSVPPRTNFNRSHVLLSDTSPLIRSTKL